MKKLTLISAVLVAAGILYTGANSANAQSKLSFGLNVGYSAPSGDFSSTTPSKEPVVASPSTDTTHIAGYAKGGFHFNVYAAYMFSPVVGGMISIGGSMNGYDIATLDENVVTASGGGASSAPVVTASGSYYVGEYLIGPYILIPTPGKLKIEFKALFGLTSMNYPTLSYSESAGGFTASGNITVKSASGFGYNIGAGIEYLVTDQIGLHFDIAYGGTTASYPSITQTASETGFPTTTKTQNTAMTMSVGMIQPTVGVSINL